MSFSGNIKAAISALPPDNDCCKEAELLAMLAYSAHFSEDEFKFITETPETADILTSLLLVLLDIIATPEIKENAENETVFYKTEITDKGELSHLIDFCGGIDKIHRIDTNRLVCPECRAAYLRGAFLAAGFVNPPDNTYHLELSTPHADLAADTLNLLAKTIGLPKMSTRKASQIVYFRESTLVEDFLTLIGASKFAMEIMNEQIKREFRNLANRQNNFELANMDKTGRSADRQIDAINYIIDSGRFDDMNETMKKIALLRIESNQLTLSQIGEKMSPRISKSQVSKILSKIEEFKSKIENEMIGKEK